MQLQKKPKILFALPIIGHPRHAKRIEMLKHKGFNVEAVAFERDYQGGRMPNCLIHRLCKIKHRHYFLRIFNIIRSLFPIRDAISKNDFVYAFGLDMALTAYISGIGLGKPILLEVGDIVPVQLSSGIKGIIFRIIDRFMVNNCCLLVVISPGFLDEYYYNLLKTKTPAIIIENKIEAPDNQNLVSHGNSNKNDGVPLIDRPLRIGYFGMLRDEWSWNVLELLASRHPKQFEIIFAGLPVNPEDLPNRVLKYDNMYYLGRYRSPEDLPELYGSVDMVWACYHYIKPSDSNLRSGRPNRFFESCAYRKPLFARSGCHFSYDVSRYKIGLNINSIGVEETLKEITSISPSDLTLWSNNISKLPLQVYTYTTEADDLASKIRNVLTVK